MICPACKKHMLVMEFEGVELDFCPACRGCWLDEGELALILHENVDLPAGRKGGRRCPHCLKKMTVGPLPGTEVEVDACPAKHGLWLDAGELEAIARSRAAPGRATTLAGYCGKLFGTVNLTAKEQKT